MDEQQILKAIQAALDSEPGRLASDSSPTAAGQRVIDRILTKARGDIDAASADGVADVQG